jgi:hypothetical protein
MTKRSKRSRCCFESELNARLLGSFRRNSDWPVCGALVELLIFAGGDEDKGMIFQKYAGIAVDVARSAPNDAKT